MALLADLVLETANAPGTGTINLLGAQPERVSFYTGFGSPSSALVYYVVSDNTIAEWGIGTFTHGSPDTLARTTVIGNTSGTTARLNFTGTCKVYNSLPASKTVYVDNSNNVVVPTGARFASVSGGVAIGSGMMFFGSVAPAGWLFCGGQWISRTTYSALFSAIGTTYGAADGVTYFALPDLRGRVPVGMDNMGGTYAGRISGVVAGTTLGAGGGDQWLHAHGHGVTVNDTIHTHGISDPGHAHAVNDPGHVHAQSGTVLDNVADGVSVKATAGNGYNFRQYNTQSNAAGVGIFPAATGVTVNAAATGVNSGTALVNGAGAGQNVQPSLICNHIIFAGV